MRISTSSVALALALSTIVAACGGDDAGDPTDPGETAPPATVSGIVKSTSGSVVAGAAVTSGSATATTGADGRFELKDLQAGTVLIAISAARFEPLSQSVTLSAGANAHDVMLSPRSIYTYQSTVAYLPFEVAEYKAAIVFLPGLMDPGTGNPLDSRALVSGTSVSGCSIWCVQSERTEVRKRAMALVGGNVALIGTTTLVDAPASYETVAQSLTQYGIQSAHPELAGIPIFFVGHSMGGCTAYGFSRAYGARVAGFLTMKGGCHNLGPAGAAAGVPGLFLIGQVDEAYRRENITAVFEAGRMAGAPWAVSIDAYDHRPIADFDLMFSWIDAVLAARLPLTPGGPLRAITESSGWLGDRSSGAISPYACYASNRANASWLPTEAAALDWQRMAGGSVVVGDC